MGVDLYSFTFRGVLAEEALDKAGRKKYYAEEAFFSEELAKNCTLMKFTINMLNSLKQ